MDDRKLESQRNHTPRSNQISHELLVHMVKSDCLYENLIIYFIVGLLPRGFIERHLKQLPPRYDSLRV